MLLVNASLSLRTTQQTSSSRNKLCFCLNKLLYRSTKGNSFYSNCRSRIQNIQNNSTQFFYKLDYTVTIHTILSVLNKMIQPRHFGMLLVSLLSLFQQHFLGLVQSKLQGVEFARIFLHCIYVLPQLSAAFLAAHSRR